MDPPDSTSPVAPVDETDDETWKKSMSHMVRDGMTDKIEQAMVAYGTSLPRNAREMENRVFSRAGSKAEYMDFMGRVILHLNIIGSNHDFPIGLPWAAARIEEVSKDSYMAMMPAAMANKIPSGMAAYPPPPPPRTVNIPKMVPNGKFSQLPDDEFQPPEQPESMMERKVSKAPGPVPQPPSIPDTVPKAGKSPMMGPMAGPPPTGMHAVPPPPPPPEGHDEEDIRTYICGLIIEDRERKMKQLEKDNLDKEELEKKKQAVSQFSDLCLEKNRLIPSYLCDRGSHKLFKDPVITPSGYTYERSRIENHLRNNGPYDPVTRVSLTAELLIPNLIMKQVVVAYMAENSYGGRTRTTAAAFKAEIPCASKSFIADNN